MIFDLVFVGLLVLFAVIGYHRGLIRSLGALLGLLVAFVAASMAVAYLQQPVADWLEPHVQQVVEQKLADYVAQCRETGEGALPLPAILQSLMGDEELAAAIGSALNDFVNGQIESNQAQLAQMAAVSIAFTLAKILVGVAAFLVILWVWKKLVKVLDGVCQLPVLRTLNRAGGILFGVVEAAVLIWVCCQVISLLGTTPEMEESVILAAVLGNL